MSFPSSVRIGGITYEVHVISRLRDEQDVLGRALCHKQILEIDAGLSVDAQAATLLHEVVHAILYQTGHDDHMEPHIRALGYGLLVFMQDNAELVRSLIDPPSDYSDLMRYRDLLGDND